MKSAGHQLNSFAVIGGAKRNQSDTFDKKYLAENINKN